MGDANLRNHVALAPHHLFFFLPFLLKERCNMFSSTGNLCTSGFEGTTEITATPIIKNGIGDVHVAGVVNDVYLWFDFVFT